MSDTQRPFALALSANRATEHSNQTVSTAAACYARSEAEADGRGVQMAKERWPTADGWGSHQAVSLELRKDWCAAAVALFESNPSDGPKKKDTPSHHTDGCPAFHGTSQNTTECAAWCVMRQMASR